MPHRKEVLGFSQYMQHAGIAWVLQPKYYSMLKFSWMGELHPKSWTV